MKHYDDALHMPYTYTKTFPTQLFLSLGMHALLLFQAQSLVRKNFTPPVEVVKLQIYTPQKPEIPVIPEIKKEEPKIPEKPKIKKIPLKKRSVAQAPIKKEEEIVKPVFGVDKDTVPTGPGLAAPVGNTVMTEDDGQRVDAKDIKALSGEDLSSQAILIKTTLTIPKYTEEALNREIEGIFPIDVYVDEKGLVQKAELSKKIGYGMDERVIDAIKEARFTPAKNRFGISEAGWTEIKFRLEIP